MKECGHVICLGTRMRPGKRFAAPQPCRVEEHEQRGEFHPCCESEEKNGNCLRKKKVFVVRRKNSSKEVTHVCRHGGCGARFALIKVRNRHERKVLHFSCSQSTCMLRCFTASSSSRKSLLPYNKVPTRPTLPPITFEENSNTEEEGEEEEEEEEKVAALILISAKGRGEERRGGDEKEVSATEDDDEETRKRRKRIGRQRKRSNLNR